MKFLFVYFFSDVTALLPVSIKSIFNTVLIIFFPADVWVVQGFKNWRGCPRAVHQFKVFRNSAVWYAVIATNAAENNTEIYSFTAVGSLLYHFTLRLI